MIRNTIISSLTLTFALAAPGCDDGRGDVFEDDRDGELAYDDEHPDEYDDEYDDEEDPGDGAIDELEAEIAPEHAEFGFALHGTMRGRCADGSTRDGTWSLVVPAGASELSGSTSDDLGNEGQLTGVLVGSRIRMRERSDLGACSFAGRVDMNSLESSGTWRCNRCAGSWGSPVQIHI